MLTLADIGQGKTSVSQLWHNDIRLINAIPYVNWQDPDANFQVELCETCGIVRCQPQGWVSIRRLGAGLVGILPAFSIILESSEALRNEYLPPDYLAHSSIYLEKSQYERLRETVSWPEYDQLPQLTAWEAAKLFQWEAPYQMLGDVFRVPRLPPDEVVIASSEGSFLEQVPMVSKQLHQLVLRGQESIAIRPVSSLETVISFYLDLAGTPEWNALVSSDGHYGLYLEPGYVISR